MHSWPLVLLALSVFMPSAMAAAPKPLPANRLVNKVSLVLTGRVATAADVARFEQGIRVHPQGFPGAYAALLSRVMATPAYATVIERAHALWWHLPSGNAARHAAYVVAGDLPYTEIYTRDYIYVDAAMAPVYRQLGAKTIGDLPTTQGEYSVLRLSRDESRFRGLFGSPEFLRTYPDTPTNVNRKRSSQVFRIAFCETLANPVVTAPTLKTHGDEHGESPDCVGCHRRLDPMARFFDQWRPPSIDGFFAEFDPSRPNAGTLFLGGDGGMARRYKGHGDGDLGAIVVRQPEFGQCVAKLAWNSVFGREVALDGPSQSTLLAAYRRSTRFNAAVIAALDHPYFWSETEAPALRYADVRPILRDCGGCHADSEATRFDPETFPFAQGPANAELLKQIWGAVNHDEGYRPMPKAPRPKLPQESLDTVRAWIANGAHGDNGARTLTEEQVEEILP